MLYLTSRSIDPTTARNLMVEGFFVPVLEEIDVEEFREDLSDLILARLN
jgi:Fe-S cluster assembly protein SufD